MSELKDVPDEELVERFEKALWRVAEDIAALREELLRRLESRATDA